VNFFIYPSKDTTLYKQKKLRKLNAGSDEVIELKSIHDEALGHDVARILIEFDLTGINDVKSELVDVKYILNLKLMQSDELLPLDVIEVFPLRKPWKEGNGRFIPSSDAKKFSPGANWKYADGESDKWVEGSNTDSTGGGLWYDKQMCLDLSTTPSEIDCKFKFTKNFSDVKIDITRIVKYWLDGSIDNNGLIIKYKDEEQDNAGNIKFYSSDTNTIYYPFIQVSYNDYFFNPCQKRKVNKLVCPTAVQETIAEVFPTPTPTHHMCPPSGSIESGSLHSGTLESGSLFSGSLLSGVMESGSAFSDVIVYGSLESANVTTSNISSGSIGSGSLESGTIDSVDLAGVVVTSCIKTEPSSDTSKYSFDLIDVDPTLQQVMDADIIPHIKRIKKEYRTLSRERISVGIRSKYPTKTFSSKSKYDLDNYTLEPMKYSVRDAETDEIIIDFSHYSKISCDARGHYFNFDFTCLAVGRIYKFLILVESEVGHEVHEDKRRFIVRS